MATITKEFETEVDNMTINGKVQIWFETGTDESDPKVTDHWFKEIYFGEHTAFHLEDKVLKNLDLLELCM